MIDVISYPVSNYRIYLGWDRRKIFVIRAPRLLQNVNFSNNVLQIEQRIKETSLPIFEQTLHVKVLYLYSAEAASESTTNNYSKLF